MKKGSILLKIVMVVVTLFCMMQMASCRSSKKLVSYCSPNGGNDMVLLEDNNIIFNLVVSEDVKASLQKKYPEIYESFSKYFYVLSGKCIDSNVIYIRPATNHYGDVFSAYDEKLYNRAKEDLCLETIGTLAYKDYYVCSNDECVMIVCGSEQTVFDALKNLDENHISKPVSDSDTQNYLMDVPLPGFYYGDYLSGATIAMNQIENYNLIYASSEYSREGEETAKYFYDYFYQNYDVKLNMSVSSYLGDYPYEIIFGNTAKKVCQDYYKNDPGIFSYKIVQEDDKLYIMGGSEWAIKYAADTLIDKFFSKCEDVPANYTAQGNVYGVKLFDNYEDSNLRLMSQNVWGYEANSEVWQSLGKDSALSSRLDEFAGAFMAYKPDALCLQEIRSSWYTDNIVKMMNKKGCNYALVDNGQFHNQTPIIYNQDTLTLHKSGFLRFPTWYMESKSYTWGYFTHNQTGKEFVLLSTHLWHQSVKSYEGSDALRMSEMDAINAALEELISLHDVPCFVMGDFNCATGTSEFKYMINLGYSNCHDMAIKYTDNSRGRMVCNENVYSGGVMKGTYKKNAIDHALIKNQKDIKIIAYDYVSPAFYGALSDHAALCMDVSL